MLKKSLYGLAALVVGFESASALTLPVSQIPASALTTITNQALGFTVRSISTDPVDTGNDGIFNNTVPFLQSLGPITTNTINGLPSAGLVPSAVNPGFYATNSANFQGANNPNWANILAASPYASTISGCAIPSDANGFWAFNAANFTNAYINCDGNAGADDNNGPFVSVVASGSTNPASNYPKNYFPGIPDNTDPADGNSYENNEVSFAGYMFLPAGTVTFNANSDDYTQVLVSPLLNPWDTSAQVVVIPFTAGGRGSATSTQAVTVPSSGWYSVRLDFEQGTGGIVEAFFTTDAKGNNILVNDTTQPTALLAYPTPDLWANAYLVSASPAAGSTDVSPLSTVSIILQDGTNSAIKLSSVGVTINGVAAAAANLAVTQTASFTPNGQPNGNLTTVTITPTISSLLPADQTVTFGVTYTDNHGNKATNDVTIVTAPNLAKASGVSTAASNQGFYVYPYLSGTNTTTDAGQPNTVVWTELQLTGEFGTNAALQGTNWPAADYGATPIVGYRGSGVIWTNYINWDIDGPTAGDGDFQSTDGITGYPHSEFPGIEFGDYTDETNPGAGALYQNNFTMAVDTWLYFPASGSYTMSVTSDDGFVVKSGVAPGDFFGSPLGSFNGGRGWTDTDFTVGVLSAGFYPFELIYEEGGGGANCEWLTISNGVKSLVNDSTNVVKAYLVASNSPPFIFQVSPDPATIDGFPNTVGGPANNGTAYTAPWVKIANGNGRTLSSAQLSINGTAVTTTLTTSSNGVTIVATTNASYTAGANNTVTVVYTDSTKVSFTNSYVVAAGPTPNPATDILHGYVGYALGNGTYTTGHTGKTGDYAFDGTTAANGSFFVPNASFVNAATANDCLAVSFWVYRYDINNSSAFWFMAPQSNNGERGFQAHTPWSDDTIYFDTSGCCDGTQSRINQSITMFPAYTTDGGTDPAFWNQWHFFVFSKNGPTDKEIWIDGSLFLQSSSDAPLPADITSFYMAGGPAGAMDGKIDDFAIYSNALVTNGVDGGSVSNLFSGAVLPSKVPGVLAYWDFNEVTGTTPAGPSLTIAESGANIVISYPSTPTGFSLIGTTNLVGGTWVSITNAAVTSGGVSTVTLPAPKVDWFFQLKN